MECQSSSAAAAALHCNSQASHEVYAYYPDGALIDDLSATTDSEIIEFIHEVNEHDGSSDNATPGEVNRSRLQSLNPSELTPFVVARWPSSLNSLEIPKVGKWNQKLRGAYTAVRGVAVTSSPRYVGVKREMEFRTVKGAKTGWYMTQYYAVHNLVIEDKMCFCKVFELKGDGHRSKNKKQKKDDRNSSQKKIGDAGKQYHYQQVPHPLVGASSSSPTIQVPAGPVPAPVNQPSTFFDQGDEMMIDPKAQEHPYFGDMQMDALPLSPEDFKFNCCFDALPSYLQDLDFNYFDDKEEDEEKEKAVLVPDGGRKQKRGRSEVWDGFTKIQIKEDVYAVCSSCDAMLKADSGTIGTATLWRHYKQIKHPKLPNQAS